MYKRFKNLYYAGADAGMSKDNMCFAHVDKLSSYLFSPADVQFNVSFEQDESPIWSGAADMAGNHLTREFRRNKCALTFAAALDTALIKGCALIKLTWDANGLKPFIIQPDMFGVMREDLEDLNDQDAFVYSYYLTPSQFDRMMVGDPKAKQITAAVAAQSFSHPDSDFEQSYFREIIAGGINPIGLNSPSGQKGNVPYMATPSAQMSPQVASQLVRVDELWVMNDDARDGKGDWHCIRMAGDVVIDGEFYTRNLFGVGGDHPFVKVCPNETQGYFWGRSELANVAPVQMWLNERLDDIDRIFKRQANPARMFIGFGGITDEKARILASPGGNLIDSQPNGKIETMAPTMPPNAMEYIGMIKRTFEEVGGFTPMTSGQGDSGVRSGAQAATLLKTSSPRLRDRALIVEDQCADFGGKCFALSQAKDARVFTLPKKGLFNKVTEFMLSQLPENLQVAVDSHTSSPAFSGDNQQLAFALSARGAIDGEDLIRMVHPPYQDELILKYRDREESRAKFMQEHPELLTKGKGRK